MTSVEGFACAIPTDSMTKINGFQRVSVQTDRRNEIARSILVKEQLGLGLGLDDRKNLTLPNWLPSGIYRIMKWKGNESIVRVHAHINMRAQTFVTSSRLGGVVCGS